MRMTVFLGRSNEGRGNKQSAETVVRRIMAHVKTAAWIRLLSSPEDEAPRHVITRFGEISLRGLGRADTRARASCSLGTAPSAPRLARRRRARR